MMKAIRYHPAENGGVPRIFKIPRRQSMYRVELYVKLPGEAYAQHRPIRYPDKMTIGEVYEVATAELSAIAPEGVMVEEAYFEVWADA